MESKRKRGQKHTKKTSLLLKFLSSKKSKKKRSKTQESDVFSRQRAKKRPKKQSLGLERERGSAREADRWASHCTRTTHDFIMALRQTLKQFTSKTTAFAPLLSRASGVQMYSTVIEGLKYASSHEWYVRTNSFSQSSLFWVNFLLWCSGTHFFVFFLSLLFSYPFVTFHMHIA